MVSFERINKLNQYEDQNNIIYYAKNYDQDSMQCPSALEKNELIGLYGYVIEKCDVIGGLKALINQINTTTKINLLRENLYE